MAKSTLWLLRMRVTYDSVAKISSSECIVADR